VARPSTAEEAAEALRGAGQGRGVRIAGHGTKLRWGAAAAPTDTELLTDGLDRLVEHNPGDFTAVVQPGLALARLQSELAGAGQMLALDPPLGPRGDEGEDGATVGGVVATADAGPLRHRFFAPRDLVIGVQVALADGTVARAGGKVIKNVAGYDLAKLFTGAFGTLGLITEISLRLHPRPRGSATAVGVSDDPVALARAASAVAHRPLEPDALDVRWAGDAGEVLVRVSGEAAPSRAASAMAVLREAGVEAALDEDDEPRWAAQRAGQRSAEGVVVKVASTQARLADVLAAARAGGFSVVGRAALGLSWLTLEGAEPDVAARRVAALRERVAPSSAVVLDAPDAVRAHLDPWGPVDPGRLELMRRVKARFDPAGILNPGIYVGGI
jgi:glycolate oxidase FAD binding subunit